MDHAGALRLMAEAVEGRLSPDDERALALHLVSCSDCKTLYEGLLKAHPALAFLAPKDPTTQAVDTAVLRATTILRGDADPGPLGRPRRMPEPDNGDHPTGPLLAADLVAEDESAGEGPIGDVGDDLEPSPGSIREVFEAPAGSRDADAGPEEPEPEPEPVISEEVAPPTEPPRVTAPISVPPPAAPPVAPPTVPADLPSIPARPPPYQPPPPPPTHVPLPTSIPIPTGTVRTVPPSIPPQAVSRTARLGRPVDEVEELLEEESYSEPMPQVPPPGQRPPVGAGPWLAAIAVTIALAVLAGVLITRGQGLLGSGGDLPSPNEVRTRVARIFSQMKSLKATFSIRRLGLYRTSGSQTSLVYSFADGRYDGRIVYDRNEGYRQEVTLDVRDQEVTRAKIVQTADETRSLIGAGSNADLLVERRPPFGPPDGELRPNLGLLEDALGTVVRELADAPDLKVIGRTTQQNRELYEVRTAVKPDELTRADELDVYLDVRTFFPLIVRRTISRDHASVLGPADILNDSAIAKAFGDRERVTSELVEIDNPVVDDIILPGDFVLDTPAGLKAQTSDSSFERVARADVASKVKFKPLFPRSLPGGFREDGLAVYTGEKRGWGPGGKFPAPDSIMHASYFDGRTTIVVTERNISSGSFDLTQSPLQRNGLPITVRPVTRAEKRFFYATSPEVPPHAYGFLGDVFAMVTGYASEEDLIEILSSLTEAPTEVPAAGASPSPTVSP